MTPYQHAFMGLFAAADSNDVLHITNIILAVGAVVGPITFGFVMFKASSIFVTKELHESNAREVSRRLDRIEELLDHKRK